MYVCTFILYVYVHVLRRIYTDHWWCIVWVWYIIYSWYSDTYAQICVMCEWHGETTPGLTGGGEPNASSGSRWRQTLAGKLLALQGGRDVPGRCSTFTDTDNRRWWTQSPFMLELISMPGFSINAWFGDRQGGAIWNAGLFEQFLGVVSLRNDSKTWT